MFDVYGARKECFGTGFMLQDKGGAFYLATNRHVLEPSFEKSARVGWRLEFIEITCFDLPHFWKLRFVVIPTSGIFVSDSDREDVALVPVIYTKITEKSYDNPNVINILQVGLDMLATEKDFSEINLGDQVYFPGYPPWHDQNEGRPIMRKGSIASDPTKNYLGPGMDVSGRIIAYEAFSFEGSSGSPVFLPAFGVTLNGDPNTGNFREQKLIGINAGHLNNIDGTKHHSGISYFYRSSVLLELIAKAQKT